jgi:hypothetical protein
LGFPLGIAVLLAGLLALPFLAGFDNILGVLIVAIGLFGAWKLSRKPVVNLTGPFELPVSAAASEAPQ